MKGEIEQANEHLTPASEVVMPRSIDLNQSGIVRTACRSSGYKREDLDDFSPGGEGYVANPLGATKTRDLTFE